MITIIANTILNLCLIVMCIMLLLFAVYIVFILIHLILDEVNKLIK